MKAKRRAKSFTDLLRDGRAHQRRRPTSATTLGPSTAPVTTRDNATIVRRVVDEIWNAADLDVADELFAPAYVNHAGIIADLVPGPEGIKISVALYRTAFPTLHISIEGLLTDQETVVLSWTARSSPPTGPGQPPASPGGAMTGMMLIHLAGGQIVESWTYWDSAGVLGQLGRRPAAGVDHGAC